MPTTADNNNEIVGAGMTKQPAPQSLHPLDESREDHVVKPASAAAPDKVVIEDPSERGILDQLEEAESDYDMDYLE